MGSYNIVGLTYDIVGWQESRWTARRLDVSVSLHRRRRRRGMPSSHVALARPGQALPAAGWARVLRPLLRAAAGAQAASGLGARLRPGPSEGLTACLKETS